ncbi:hemerythrin HHE cation binding domain-containing protein [Burkholderiales bacterium JOSHI_001]|nr:hemerythrin HHE cation binding domain-containing protein [Burkholderiales bacterium JOSHI_001]
MSTSAPLTLHRAPSAGFEQPFEMLAACHERVDRMLRLLRRLRAHLLAVGWDDNARQAARDVMRYFDQAAPAHHEDEERHVFPALRAAGLHGETVQRLQREHQEMAALWPAVRTLLLRVDLGPWTPVTPDEDGTLEQYAALYEWHMAAENELVFPAAAQQLDAAATAAMGEEMSRRRGVLPPIP